MDVGVMEQRRGNPMANGQLGWRQAIGEQNKFPIYIIYIWYTLVKLIQVNSNSINKYYNINSVFL